MTADVIVVGAGIVGLCTALELAACGASVWVLDAGPQRTSTFRSAGVVRSLSVHPTLAVLAQQSITRFAEWQEWIGHPSPLVATGAIVVVPHGSAELERSAPDAIRLPTDRLCSFGYRAPSRGIVYLDRRGGTLDAHRAIADLRVALGQRGGALRSVTVTEVTSDGCGVRVGTHDGPLIAGAVVVAAGAWTTEILRALWDAPISPEFAQVVKFRTDRVPVLPLIDISRGVLIRPCSDGEILVSPRETTRAEDATYPSGDIDVNLIAHRTAAVLLDTDSLQCTGQWFGLYDCTTDGLPYVGAVCENVFVAAGFNGGGLKLAPAIARALAEAVHTGQTPTELAPLAPRRDPWTFVADFGLAEAPR